MERPPPDRRRPGSDRGDIVLGWLAKVSAVLLLGGVCALDTAAVTMAHVQGSTQADDAADAAARAWAAGSPVEVAWAAAGGVLDPTADTVDPATFRIAADGTVTLTVHHRAATTLLRHLGPLGGLTEVSSVGSSGNGAGPT